LSCFSHLAIDPGYEKKSVRVARGLEPGTRFGWLAILVGLSLEGVRN